MATRIEVSPAGAVSITVDGAGPPPGQPDQPPADETIGEAIRRMDPTIVASIRIDNLQKWFGSNDPDLVMSEWCAPNQADPEKDQLAIRAGFRLHDLFVISPAARAAAPGGSVGLVRTQEGELRWGPVYSENGIIRMGRDPKPVHGATYVGTLIGILRPMPPPPAPAPAPPPPPPPPAPLYEVQQWCKDWHAGGGRGTDLWIAITGGLQWQTSKDINAAAAVRYITTRFRSPGRVKALARALEQWGEWLHQTKRLPENPLVNLPQLVAPNAIAKEPDPRQEPVNRLKTILNERSEPTEATP